MLLPITKSDKEVDERLCTDMERYENESRDNKVITLVSERDIMN